MKTELIPAIIFGTVDDTGTKRIQVDICQTVYQGFTVFYDTAFEPLSPQGSSSVMQFIIIS